MSSSAKANAALAAALTFLLLSGCAGYLAFSRLHTSESWVRHTRDVQVVLADFAMTTARAGRLRAEYVDSGDSTLLQRYAQAVDRVRGTLASTQRLTVDNPSEQAHWKELRDLTEQRIELMDASLELKRSGKSTLELQAPILRQIIASSESSDQILRGMYEAEEQLLSQRQQRVQVSSAVTNSVLVTSLFLALILFVAHHRLLTDQVRERGRAEALQRALSARLLTLRDEERRRFARELHDSVGQHLSAMKMAIAILQNKLPGDQTLQDCIRMLDESITETRTISHLLHPPLLDEAGLSSASRWFVEGFAKRSGIAVNLDIREDTDRLSESTELVLFRMLQESLTNVHRHSGATRADVSLRTSGNEVVLRIRDYGRGIPAAVLQSLREDGSCGGVGLAGMKERLREIGGHVEINSSAPGTEIVAKVPLRRRPKAQVRISTHAAQEVNG